MSDDAHQQRRSGRRTANGNAPVGAKQDELFNAIAVRTEGVSVKRHLHEMRRLFPRLEVVVLTDDDAVDENASWGRIPGTDFDYAGPAT